MIKHFNNLGYSIVATVAEPTQYHVEYAIYSHDGLMYDQSGNATVPIFHKRGSGCYPDPVESLEDAGIAIKGSVKWDGCSNWDFSSEEMILFHGCNKQTLVNIGLILGEAWDWTKELIPETWMD